MRLYTIVSCIYRLFFTHYEKGEILIQKLKALRDVPDNLVALEFSGGIF